MPKLVRALEALVVTLSLLLAAQACGDDPSGSSGPPPASPTPPGQQPDGGEEKRQAIGPEGGEVTSADGRLKLVFPPGAVASPQEITIAAADPAGLDAAWAEVLASVVQPKLYELGPSGLAFQVPIRVEVRSDQIALQADGSAKVVTEGLWSEDQGAPFVLRGTRLETAEDGATTLSGEMDHFSPLLDAFTTDDWTVSLSVPEQVWVGEPFVGSLRLTSSKGRSAEGANYSQSGGAMRIATLSPATGELVAMTDAWGADLQLVCEEEGQGRFGVNVAWPNDGYQAMHLVPVIVSPTCTTRMLRLAVTRTGDGGGKIASAPAGIACGDPGGACEAVFAARSKVTLTATADSGSVFLGWTGAVTSDSPTIEVEMDAEKSLTAEFAKSEVSLTVIIDGDGQGSVASDVGGLSCSTGQVGTCTIKRAVGDKVFLSRLPAQGSQFDGWSGAATGTGVSVEVVLDADKTVTASFSKMPVTLPGDYTGPLTVTADPHMHDEFVFAAGAGKNVMLRVEVGIGSITITPLSGFSPSTLPTLTGTLLPDDTFVVNGTGTVAGFPNVEVRGTGSIDATGKLTIELEVGRSGTLPDGPIRYGVTGTK